MTSSERLKWHHLSNKWSIGKYWYKYQFWFQFQWHTLISVPHAGLYSLCLNVWLHLQQHTLLPAPHFCNHSWAVDKWTHAVGRWKLERWHWLGRYFIIVAAINNETPLIQPLKWLRGKSAMKTRKCCGFFWLHCRNLNVAAATCKTSSLCVIQACPGTDFVRTLAQLLQYYYWWNFCCIII